MNRVTRTAVVLLAAFAFAACAPAGSDATPTQVPIEIVKTDGSDVGRLTLSASAAGRLGIETEAVAEERIDGVDKMVMPYTALLYDADGSTWAYTNPEGLLFIREPVTVERIEGDLAILRAGPGVSTLVVTVGGAELWGAEHGVGGGH